MNASDSTLRRPAGQDRLANHVVLARGRHELAARGGVRALELAQGEMAVEEVVAIRPQAVRRERAPSEGAPAALVGVLPVLGAVLEMAAHVLPD